MYTKDGWLTARAVRYFFLIIVLAAIMGALSSCNSKDSYYYLQINDYNEETVCVNIIDEEDNIIVLLDKDIDKHANPTKIIMSIETQMGFNSIFKASEMYWSLVE